MSTSFTDNEIKDSETAVTSLIFRVLKPNGEKSDNVFGETFYRALEISSRFDTDGIQSEMILNYEVGDIIKHHATGVPFLLFLGVSQLKSEKCNLAISGSYVFFVRIGGNEELLDALLQVIINPDSEANEDDLVIDPIKTAGAVHEALKGRDVVPEDLITILPFSFGGISPPPVSLDSLFAHRNGCRNLLSKYCDEPDFSHDSEKINNLFSSTTHAVDRFQLLGVILLALYSNRKNSPPEERFLYESSDHDSIALSAEQTLGHFNPQFTNDVTSLAVQFSSRVIIPEHTNDEIRQPGDVKAYLGVNEPQNSRRKVLPKKAQNSSDNIGIGKPAKRERTLRKSFAEEQAMEILNIQDRKAATRSNNKKRQTLAPPTPKATGKKATPKRKGGRSTAFLTCEDESSYYEGGDYLDTSSMTTTIRLPSPPPLSPQLQLPHYVPLKAPSLPLSSIPEQSGIMERIKNLETDNQILKSDKRVLEKTIELKDKFEQQTEVIKRDVIMMFKEANSQYKDAMTSGVEVATTHCTSMGQTISNIVGVVARDKSAELPAVQCHQPQPQSLQCQSTSQPYQHPQRQYPCHQPQPSEHHLPPSAHHQPLAHHPPPPFQQHQHQQQQQVPNSPFMNYSATGAQQMTPPIKSNTWYSIPNQAFETPMSAPLFEPQMGDPFAQPPFAPPPAMMQHQQNYYGGNNYYLMNQFQRHQHNPGHQYPSQPGMLQGHYIPHNPQQQYAQSAFMPMMPHRPYQP